jgi:excisionase family DNA binding protein
MPDYLTTEKAAEVLACRQKQIYELVAQGRLRHFRDGQRLLFQQDDLDAALEARAAGVDGGTPKQGGV